MANCLSDRSGEEIFLRSFHTDLRIFFQLMLLRDGAAKSTHTDSLPSVYLRFFQLGSKYVASVSDGRLPSENVQYDFLTATYEEHAFEDEAARRNGETSSMFQFRNFLLQDEN